MKVGFNARLLHGSSLRGWNRYTINLLVELANLGVELFLYTDRPLHASHLARLPGGSVRVRVAPPMPYLWWEQYWLPKQCARDNVDLLHCPFNFGLPWFSPCPRVLTLHDAIDRVYYDRDSATQQKLSLAYYQTKFYHWVARQRAEVVITVSEYSKQDLIAYLDIPEAKIAVTYEGADCEFDRQFDKSERTSIRAKYQLLHPYIFYIGGWEKRKNIPFLVRAFAQAKLAGVKLVLAGGNDNHRDSLLQLADSLGVASEVMLLGWVDNVDLPVLYAEALGFVYPSEYEGFGLQLCEAMAVGCPTLAADATCLPEVLGDGGDLFALTETTDLVELLRRLHRDPTYRDYLSDRAKKRSNDFNWQETASATKLIYQKYINCHEY
jgi:glycosyltransferase involved in cell wall biosynthesis